MTLLETDVPSKGTPFPTIDGPKTDEKVCIVGGGPAGIHMAISLKERGFQNMIIFEKTGRVGGKSYDTTIDGFYRPQGTVFLTADYFDTLVRLAQKYDVGELSALHGTGVGETTNYRIKSISHEKQIVLIKACFLNHYVKTLTNSYS